MTTTTRRRRHTDTELDHAARLALAPGGSVRSAAKQTGISIGSIRNHIAANPHLAAPDAADQIARQILIKICRGIDIGPLTPTGTGLGPHEIQHAYDHLVEHIAQEGGAQP